MRDLFYIELRNAIREMKAENEDKTELLLDTIKEIENLSCIARKEGLLALEEASINLSEDKRYLQRMITLIVDGTYPELVEQIGMASYMANDLHSYEAIIYLLQMVGILSIQAGENPRVIEEKLLAMLPDAVYDAFKKNRELEEMALESMTDEDIDMSAVERICEVDSPIKSREEGYYEAKVLEYALRCFDDRSIQRVLREVENVDLEVAMKGISGEARHRIFINLSKRLAVIVAEDMENIGGIPRREIRDAMHKMLWVFNRLLDTAEINCEESDKVQTIFRLLKLDE